MRGPRHARLRPDIRQERIDARQGRTGAQRTRESLVHRLIADLHRVRRIGCAVEQIPRDRLDRRLVEPARRRREVALHVEEEALALQRALRVAIDRVVQHHAGKRVRKTFTEREPQVEPIVRCVLASWRVGAAEHVFEVMLEFMREHVRVVLVRVDVLEAQHVNALRRIAGRKRRRAIERRDDVALGHVAVVRVVQRAPVGIERGQVDTAPLSCTNSAAA